MIEITWLFSRAFFHLHKVQFLTFTDDTCCIVMDGIFSRLPKLFSQVCVNHHSFHLSFSIPSKLFLGFCFLHLLPDVEEDMQQAFQGKEASSGNFPFAGFMVALGLLLILVIEKLVELCKSTSDKSHIPSEQLPSPSGKTD